MVSRAAVIGAVGGVAVGGSFTYWYVKSLQPPQRPIVEVPSLTDHPTGKYGLPTADQVRVFTDFIVSYDNRLRNPKWVIEHLSREKSQGPRNGNRHNSSFFEDPQTDMRFSAKLADFKNSGYDRGHMAPAANHKVSQDTIDETFSLTNVSPQVGAGFNRDYWARFERYVYELTQTCCSNVWVVTGPLYLPRPAPVGSGWKMEFPMLGRPPQLVAVPTHFYKVVFGERAPGEQAIVGAFVMPNAVIDPQVPLSSFSVPLSALEEVSGTQFFPGFLNKERREVLDEAALKWQRFGQAELKKVLPAGELIGEEPLLLPFNKGTDAFARALGGLSAHGISHICDHHNGCKLPSEKWWEAKAAAEGKKAREKTLERRKSARF